MDKYNLNILELSMNCSNYKTDTALKMSAK